MFDENNCRESDPHDEVPAGDVQGWVGVESY